MSTLRRITSWFFLALAVLIITDAAAIFTIVLWPESDIGRWLAANEPVFRFLQASPFKSSQNETSPPPEPKPKVHVRMVQGPHYVLIGPGHPIFERPDIHSPVIGEVQREVNLPALAEQDGWFLLEFSIGRGWVHSFIRSGPKLAAVGVRGGQPVLKPPEAVGEGGLKQMKVEIFVGVDTGEPDAVALDGSLLNPSAEQELFRHYSSSDLAALPLGVDPERLLLATRLMGEEVGEIRLGEFIIRYQDKSWAEEAEKVLKNLRTIYLETFAPIIPERASEDKVFVLLLPSFDAYQEFYPEAQSGRGGTVRTAGHYEAGIIALYPDPQRGRGTLNTLVHEATHHYNHTILGFPRDRSALWLDEGIANYFGNSTIDKDGNLKLGVIATGPRPWRGAGDTPVYRLPGQLSYDNPPLARIVWLQNEMRRGWHFRFSDLLSREARSSFYSENPMRNYSISWMLVHFLMEGKDGSYREPFMRYIREEVQGRGGVEALEKAFGVPCEQLEEELRDYVFKQ
jgi:hypothetical protein